MYEYLNGCYVYYGNNECGTPIKEIKTISQKEANYWDKLDKQIKEQEHQTNKKY